MYKRGIMVGMDHPTEYNTEVRSPYVLARRNQIRGGKGGGVGGRGGGYRLTSAVSYSRIH